MKPANIPHYLRSQVASAVIVEFDDGDRYPVAALDLQGENPDGEFEISVAFADCLGESRAYARAREAGSPQRCPGSWWMSDPPREPVGMQYALSQIRSIFDGAAGYFVYEKEAAGHAPDGRN